MGPITAVENFKTLQENCMGFQHLTSSPHYQCSNGFTESQVFSVKTALLKAKTTQGNLDIDFLYLRTTPIDHKLPSPADPG